MVACCSHKLNIAAETATPDHSSTCWLRDARLQTLVLTSYFSKVDLKRRCGANTVLHFGV